ncbi:MAG: hypothetical protein AAFN27_22160 [Pseudomonadota bacterium]
MQDLLEFPVEDPADLVVLATKAARTPDDDAAQIAYGLALFRAGCSYQAARLLRPRRKLWKGTGDEADARAALDAQSWWNKTWKELAQNSQRGNYDLCLEMLGDRARLFWDFPPLLAHLTKFAIARGEFDLAENIARRIYLLSQRGVEKINMVAFEYGSQEDLIEILWRRGDPRGALEIQRNLTPNPGNAMAYEIRRAQLLVATGLSDEAMSEVASILRTALKERTGYSREMRIDFVDKSDDLDPLRARPDWSKMYEDPSAWLKAR